MKSKGSEPAPVPIDDGSKKLNTALTIILSLGAIYFVYHTYHNPEDFVIFPQNNFDSSKEKISIFTELVLLSIFIVIGLQIVSKVFVLVFQISEDSYLLTETKKAIENCFLHSFIIMSLFAYLLSHDEYQLKSSQIVHFAHWIFAALVSTVFGALARGKTNLNFKQFGYVMTAFLEAQMVAQIYGCSLLKQL